MPVKYSQSLEINQPYFLVGGKSEQRSIGGGACVLFSSAVAFAEPHPYICLCTYTTYTHEEPRIHLQSALGREFTTTFSLPASCAYATSSRRCASRRQRSPDNLAYLKRRSKPSENPDPLHRQLLPQPNGGSVPEIVRPDAGSLFRRNESILTRSSQSDSGDERSRHQSRRRIPQER